MENKRKLLIKNKEIKLDINIYEEWSFNYETKIWSVPISTTSNLETGNYLLYLKDRFILDIKT
ncbi:MAG: hypothetical protein ACRC4M_00600, partial [Mycoplasma sp.]